MPVYFESKKNRRKINQDYYLYLEYRVNHEAKMKAMLVADGMGGLESGEVAAQKAGEKWMLKLQKLTISNQFLGKSLNDQLEQLKNFSYHIINEINEEVYQELSDRGISGGTTLTTAILYWDTLIFSNCGDSPAYYFGKEERAFYKLSQEQNAAEELLKEGKVGRDSMEYWNHKHMLTDYIGKYRKAIPYVTSIPFTSGDCLLMGSDGAFGKLKEEMIKKCIITYYDKPERIIPYIMQQAEKQGEEDNQTLLCYMDEPPKGNLESHKEKRGLFRKRQAVKPCIL